MATKLDQMQDIVKQKFESNFNVLPVTKSDEILEDYNAIIGNIKARINAESSRYDCNSIQLKFSNGSVIGVIVKKHLPVDLNE